MASNLALYDSVLSSNLSPNVKSDLRRWFEGATGMRLSVPSAGKIAHHAKRGMSAVRQSGEAVITGGILGLIHVEGKTGLDVFGVPVDAILWGLATFGGIAAGEHELGADSLNVAADCLTVFSFRMTTNFLTARKVAKGQAVPSHLIPGSKIHGESVMGEDPILRAARNIHL